MPTNTTGIDALLTTNMQLGDYTFAANPAGLAIPTQRRAAAGLETIDGMQFYSWGVYLPGRSLTLQWNKMTPAQFSELATILEADAQVVWRPRTGSDYNVQVMELTGEYFIGLTADAAYRQNVTMTLLIVSEVS